MKKILSLVLVIAMMASLVVFAPAASAADNGYVVEVSDIAEPVVQGDEVVFTVKITTPGVFRNFQFPIEYDETKLENPRMAMIDPARFPLSGTAGTLSHADANWGATVSGESQDATAGYDLFTITFDVKEDALGGEAFVRVAPLSGVVAAYIQVTTGQNVYDWTSIEGTVTVLPEGCKTAPVTPADDMWDFEDGVIYGILDENISGDIAIPSQIGGVDVIEIAGAAFDGLEITSVIVPETVEYIADGAFYNLYSCTDIYVLNPDCEFDPNAMGYEGSWRSGKVRNPSLILNADETAALLTVHGIAGSTAQAYAEEGDGYDAFGWAEYAAPTVITVDVNGATTQYQAAGSEVVAPAGGAKDGVSIVGWNVGGDFVLPGDVVAVDGDITFEAVTVAMETVSGASMKVVDTAADTALRFTATINMADYAAIEEAFGAANVSHGMLIVPQQYVAKAGGFTHDALETYGKGMLDFEMTGCYEIVGDDYVLAASVRGFSAVTLAKNPQFNAVAYIAIEIDGVTTYVYSDYDITTARAAKFVITNALTTATGNAKTWLTELLGNFS